MKNFAICGIERVLSACGMNTNSNVQLITFSKNLENGADVCDCQIKLLLAIFRQIKHTVCSGQCVLNVYLHLVLINI